MALNFPDTTGQPTNGTFTHTENGTTWSWDGVKWTSKPSGKFTDGSESAPSISFDADQDTGIFSAAANELGFSTGGSRKLTIDSAGNVGIGTNSPTNAALHVEGRNFAFGGPGSNESGAGNVYIGNYDNPLLDSYDRNVRIGSRNEIQIELNTALTATEYSNSILFSSPSGIGLLYSANNGNSTRSGVYPFYYSVGNAVTDDYIFFQAGNSYLWFDADTGRLGINRSSSTGWSDTLDVNGTARVTGIAKFDSNVGIGTDNPTQKLVVKGDGDGIRIEDGNATDGYNIIRHDPTGFMHVVGDQTTYSGYRFFTNDTAERLTILNNGAIGLGTSSPREVLHVNGNIALGSSNSSNYITFKGTTGDTTPNEFTMTWIGERIYDATEKSELLLMKGNDVVATSGPDRIRHVAGEHVFEVYEQGEWSYSTSFETNGANANYDAAMIVKPSGNIRKPMQCLVSAAASSNFTTSYAAQSITNQYSNERNDISSDYNSSTGIFTAPETGYYEIRHMMTATGSAGTLEPKIHVNGTERGRAYMTVASSGSNPRTVTAQITHYLVAGDTVQPRYHWSSTTGCTVYGNSSVYMTHFNIYFLQ